MARRNPSPSQDRQFAFGDTNRGTPGAYRPGVTTPRPKGAEVPKTPRAAKGQKRPGLKSAKEGRGGKARKGRGGPFGFMDRDRDGM